MDHYYRQVRPGAETSWKCCRFWGIRWQTAWTNTLVEMGVKGRINGRHHFPFSEIPLKGGLGTLPPGMGYIPRDVTQTGANSPTTSQQASKDLQKRSTRSSLDEERFTGDKYALYGVVGRRSEGASQAAGAMLDRPSSCPSGREEKACIHMWLTERVLLAPSLTYTEHGMADRRGLWS